MGRLREAITAALESPHFLDDVTQWQAAVRSARAFFSQVEPARGWVLIAHPDPRLMLAGIFAGIERGCALVLGSAQWKAHHWNELQKVLTPAYSWGEITPSGNPTLLPDSLCGTLSIPTGGSHGGLRLSVHTEQTLAASAQATGDFFQINKGCQGHCFLPLHHVSGLMQAVRAAVMSGSLWLGTPKAWENADLTPQEGSVTSLVPTLLKRWLEEPQLCERLRQMEMVFVGGAALPLHLCKSAVSEGIKLAPVYGMTETASMVIAVKPETVATNPHTGECLPHTRAETDPEGMLHISTTSLHLGYLETLLSDPHSPREEWFATGDLAEYENGGCRIIGRADRSINTGGEKVHPAEVEALLGEHPMIEAVAVLGVPDAQWGEKVSCAYVTKATPPPPETLKAFLENQLAPYQIPKEWRRLDALPLNDRNKLDYKQLQALFHG